MVCGCVTFGGSCSIISGSLINVSINFILQITTKLGVIDLLSWGVLGFIIFNTNFDNTNKSSLKNYLIFSLPVSIFSAILVYFSSYNYFFTFLSFLILLDERCSDMV